ncbi:MAG: protocatechuate 3,4-dioxygenase [Anaplasma sp.]
MKRIGGLRERLHRQLRGISCLLAVCLLCFSHEAAAVDPVIINCVETPEIRDISEMPLVFNLSNNLSRKPGSSTVADGELIYVVGRVTDAECRPLGNVNVFIWQADSRGFYSGGASASGTGSDAGSGTYDVNFSGSGKATTDNLGNFSFITVMPGRHMGRSPRIHFLVKREGFPEFQTEMFFEGPDDHEDSNLSRIPKAMQWLLTARRIDQDVAGRNAGREGNVKKYEFNITFAEGFDAEKERE